MTENTERKQRGTPFRKGQSGNPAGKPKGARHKTTLLAEKLMHADAKNIVNAVLTAARDGDMTAARLVLDRIAPARRDNLVRFELPEIKTPAHAVAAISAVLRAVAAGELTPGEASEIARLIESFIRTFETLDIDERLKRLEGKAELASLHGWQSRGDR